MAPSDHKSTSNNRSDTMNTGIVEQREEQNNPKEFDRIPTGTTSMCEAVRAIALEDSPSTNLRKGPNSAEQSRSHRPASGEGVGTTTTDRPDAVSVPGLTNDDLSDEVLIETEEAPNDLERQHGEQLNPVLVQPGQVLLGEEASLVQLGVIDNLVREEEKLKLPARWAPTKGNTLRSQQQNENNEDVRDAEPTRMHAIAPDGASASDDDSTDAASREIGLCPNSVQHQRSAETAEAGTGTTHPPSGVTLPGVAKEEIFELEEAAIDSKRGQQEEHQTPIKPGQVLLSAEDLEVLGVLQDPEEKGLARSAKAATEDEYALTNGSIMASLRHVKGQTSDHGSNPLARNSATQRPGAIAVPGINNSGLDSNEPSEETISETRGVANDAAQEEEEQGEHPSPVHQSRQQELFQAGALVLLNGVLHDPVQEELDLQARVDRDADNILLVKHNEDKAPRAAVATLIPVVSQATVIEAEAAGVSDEKHDNTSKEQKQGRTRGKAYLGVGLCLGCVIVASAVGARVARDDRARAPPSSDVLEGINSNNNTNATPTAPLFDQISSIEVLYRAVDAYLLDDSPNSSVAIRYGHPIGSWDVSRVSNFESVFSVKRNGLAASFDQDLSGWDVSAATNLGAMFFGASVFDQDLSQWNVGRARNMRSMFEEAVSCRQDVSTWNVTSATDMSRMFSYVRAFDSDLSSWNVGRVKDMNRMFLNAGSFEGNVSRWEVGQVEDMSYMFSNTRLGECDLSKWNTSGVRSMEGMFANARHFGSGDLSSWDVSRVTSTSRMFYGAATFRGNIASWDVSSLRDGSSMFAMATAFNSNVSSWNVSSVNNMRGMFFGASSFNGSLYSWDVSGVEDMSSMFAGASSFERDLSSWDVSNVTNMAVMFANASRFNSDLSKWNVSRVGDTTSQFHGAARFDQNLCAWGDLLYSPPTIISEESGVLLNVNKMFQGSACPAEQDPVLASSRLGPLCHVCYNASEM